MSEQNSVDNPNPSERPHDAGESPSDKDLPEKFGEEGERPEEVPGPTVEGSDVKRGDAE